MADASQQFVLIYSENRKDFLSKIIYFRFQHIHQHGISIYTYYFENILNVACKNCNIIRVRYGCLRRKKKHSIILIGVVMR